MIGHFLLVGILAGPGNVTPPDPPAPAPAPITAGVPGGKSRHLQRLAVRIDGQLVTGTQQEIAALLASLARKQAAEATVPIRSITAVKREGRRLSREQIPQIRVATPVSVPIDAVLLEEQRLLELALKEAYHQAYMTQLLANKAAWDADDERAAQLAAEMLLL